MSADRHERSLTDLMAGVAVVFLLMAVIFIQKANREREQTIEQRLGPLDRQKHAVEQSLASLRDELTRLNTNLDGGFLDVDGGLNSLTITFKNLQFEKGHCETPREYETQLRDGAKMLVTAICGSVNAIQDAGASASIVLEGHTDDARFTQTVQRCGVFDLKDHFENNVRASAARAQSVFFSIRSELKREDAGTETSCLDHSFIVSGRGQAVPLDAAHPDAGENRRLVIQVRGDMRL